MNDSPKNTTETASDTASGQTGEDSEMRKHVAEVDLERTEGRNASRRPLSVPDIQGRDLLY